MTPSSRSSVVELGSPGLTVLRALQDVGIGAAIGAGYTFLALLVLGIVGEEALSAYYGSLDLDPLFRASMGALLVVAGVLGVVVPVLVLVDRFLVLGLAERQAAAERQTVSGMREVSGTREVPAHRIRVVLGSVPGAGLATAGIIILLAFGLIGVIALGMIAFGEEFREEPVVWIGLVGSALLCGGGLAMRWAASRVTSRIEPRVVALRRRWARLLTEAERADAARRESAQAGVLPRVVAVPPVQVLERGARTVLIASGVAAVVFFASVFLRQQCRGCDPITWADPIENAIDVISLLGGGSLVLCGVVGAVLWLGGLVLQRVRESAMRRWVADGVVRRADAAELRPFLVGLRAAESASRALAAVGTTALIFGIAIDWIGWREADGAPLRLAAAVAVAVALLLSILDAPRARRERQALRDATFPGDVGPAVKQRHPEKSLRRRGVRE